VSYGKELQRGKMAENNREPKREAFSSSAMKSLLKPDKLSAFSRFIWRQGDPRGCPPPSQTPWVLSWIHSLLNECV
jgi:hypothetical protein